MSTRLLMPHRPVRRLGVPVVAAALLAGCGAAAATGGTTSPSSGPSGPCVTSGTQPTPAPTTAGGQGTASTALPLPSPPVPLIVYSAQGYDSTMTKAFTKATGIPVHARRRQHWAPARQGAGRKEQSELGPAVGRRRHRVCRARPAGPAAHLRACGSTERGGSVAGAGRSFVRAGQHHDHGLGHLQLRRGERRARRAMPTCWARSTPARWG